ncbi:FtsK/SpoIIIE domain-containing protein [Neomicrococcus lactis]|uniref:FtsK/SpoIIIE domain-containing protein n=1 Tax=Neomicrococcus lactis TaxID=732241 RepID=UPI002300FA38|nr:FtsK/SpoIIIE domain-containing protein [Neomicrococcus lactis]
MRTLVMIRDSDPRTNDPQFVEIVGEHAPLPRAALSLALQNDDDATDEHGQLYWERISESLPDPLPSSGLIDLDLAPEWNSTSPADADSSIGSSRSERSVCLLTISGPDAGRRFHLPRGTFTVGRRAADICVRDVSIPAQAGVVVHSAQGFSVSEFETTTDGVQPGAPKKRHLVFGESFRLGETVFRLEDTSTPLDDANDLGSCKWPPPPLKVTGSQRPGRPFMMLTAALMPVVLGLILVMFMGSWLFMLFSLMSVVTGGVPAILQWRDKKKLERQIDDALAQDRRHREHAAPDWGMVRRSLKSNPASYLASPRMPSPQSIPSSAAAVAGKRPADVQQSWALPLGMASEIHVSVDLGSANELRARTHVNVPAIATLSPLYRTLIRGRLSRATDVARAMLVRALLLAHSHRINVGVLGDGSWVPTPVRALRCFEYFSDVPQLLQFLEASPDIPLILFSSRGMDCEHLAASPISAHRDALARLILVEIDHVEDEAWGSTSPSSDQESGVFDDLHHRYSHEILVDLGVWREETSNGETQDILTDVDFDGLSFETAQVLIEHMVMIALPSTVGGSTGRVLDSGPASAVLVQSNDNANNHAAVSTHQTASHLLVDTGTLLSADSGATRPDDVLFMGGSASPDSGSVVTIDLVADGPHMLIAGTTGSGKSEALKSMLWSIVNRYAPQEVSFLHFDFKGGSTLGEFASLPHTISVETDLTHADAARMLRGIRAELSRRESIFQRIGASDYSSWRSLSARDDSLPHIARLVIVVDEVRMLLSALPEAMMELASIATIGRSLGVHLVLSTQRPLGVISPEIRANIGVCVLLRVASVQESQDVLGSSAAVSISHKNPGRAFIKAGATVPLPVQFPSPLGARRSWVIHRHGARLGPPSSSLLLSSENEEKSPYERWLRTHGHMQHRRAPQTALPARLPESVHPADFNNVAANASVDSMPFDAGVVEQGPNLLDQKGLLGLGIGNHPTMGHLETLSWNPNMLPRFAIIAGRDSGADELAAGLINQHQSDGGTTCIIDGSGLLSGYERLRTVFAYGSLDDALSISEILNHLLNELQTDASRLSDSDTATATSSDSGLDSESDSAPHIDPLSGGIRPEVRRLVVITGWSHILTRVGPREAAALEQLMTSLMRATSAQNLAIVAIGARDLTGTSLFTLLEARLYLPFGLGPEITALWPRMVEVPEHPGRGVLMIPGEIPQGREIQCLQASPHELERSSTNAHIEPSKLLRGLPRRVAREAKAVMVHELQFSTRLDQSKTDALPESDGLELGVSAPDGSTFIWHPEKIGLIVGGPGSGKTHLLKTIAEIFDSASESALNTRGRISSNLKVLGCKLVNGPNLDANDISQLQDATPRILLIDNADMVEDSLKPALERLVDSGTQLIMSVSATFKSIQRIPCAHRQRGEGSEILLSPRTPQEADVLGWHGCPVDPVPGRGIVRFHGGYRRFQAWG